MCSVYPESGRFSVFTCRTCGAESANRTSGRLRIQQTGRVIGPPGNFTHHRCARCPGVKLISEAEVHLQPPPDRVCRPLNGSNAGWSGDATDQQEFRSLQRIKKEKKQGHYDQSEPKAANQPVSFNAVNLKDVLNRPLRVLKD